MTETTKDLAKLENRVAVTAKSLIAFENLEAMKVFGDQIVSSGLTPLKKGSQVVAAILYGQELGITPMVSVNNIYPIGGKATLGVHLINAILTKAGVVQEVIRDYEPCVDFVLKGDDEKAVCINKETGAEMPRGADGKAPQGSMPVFLRQGFADEVPKSHEVKGKRIVNYKTVVKFTRMLKQPDNTFRETVVTASFSLGEATQAELLTNPAWVKYPKLMTMNRAISIGSKLIGDDLLLGFPETTEYADVHKIKYTVEDGKAVILESTLTEGPKEEGSESPTSQSTGEQGDAPVDSAN